MSEKNKLNLYSGLILAVITVGIIVADLLYKFGNYDSPFLLAFGLYSVFCMIRRVPSRFTFGIVILLVLGMAYSYIVFGEFRLTERIGEWFYLFFIFGLLQYSREAWRT